MVGKAGLASHQAAVSQAHRTGEAGLGRDTAFAPNVAIVTDLHLGVEMTSQTDGSGVEHACRDIAERPQMHALAEDDPGMMGEDGKAGSVRN